ncbi:sialate O-acetylesterase [Fulvivirga sp. M361]|uniref:sialate O-acetylesterase n=1 Tax=Fulvivirga sp. M361 TaxID=2594266 RepID=UPI001179AB1C|nr:sialate O-acetylesterase [Fulvivirga sp. M361]TRX49041.1 sialate O-acetylesterase [Fulvivirga sp. M361]
MLKKITFTLLFYISIICISNAEITLPAIISSNMVLQRNTEVTLWGWADPKEKITIQTSWLRDAIKTQADKEGHWRIELTTTNSKAAQSIRITAKNELYLENILFGEVWLCSGQSNMQQPVKGYSAQPTYGGLEAIVNARNPNIRLFNVKKHGSTTPLENVKSYESWAEASPVLVSKFSAVGYFFASKLQQVLDVPVGIIHTSWGGSFVEAWMSEEVLSEFQRVDLSGTNEDTKMNKTQTMLFNAMINPLIPYTLKGFLWYQGEANRFKPNEYKELFPAMVKDWRVRWGGNMPFYFAQIAPYMYTGNDVYQDVQNTAFIREAQLECADLIPNSGIAITMDLGDSIWIHPPKKKEVADRLLYQALAKTYGLGGINPDAPRYDSMEIREDKIQLHFKHAENGLYAYEGEIRNIEIAGEDKVFYPAQAKIEKRQKLLVWSEEVKKPVAVRYAWQNWVDGSLYGTNMLPVSSFRTDDWELDQEVKRSK